MHNKVYISLGSNLGDKISNIKKAIELINNNSGNVISIAPLYSSEPWGFESTENFLNTAIEIETKLNPFELIKTLQIIEKELGRIKNDDLTYSNRTIDLDIVFFNSKIINNKILKIPHPHLYNRRFVLLPLSQIAHDFIDPLTNKSIHKLLNECSDTSELEVTN